MVAPAPIRRYSWPTKSDLVHFESSVFLGNFDDQNQDNVIPWSTLCPCKSRTKRIGSLICWNQAELEHGWQAFKGHEENMSSHCRILNSLMQMQQPLWRHMEKVSLCKKQMIEIDAFLSSVLKRKQHISSNSSQIESDGVDNFDTVIDKFDNSSRNFHKSLECSYRSNPGTVSLDTAYSSIANTDKFRKGLFKQFDVIMQEMKASAKKILSILEDSVSREHDLPFAPGPVGDSPLHACILLGLNTLGMCIIENYYNTPELLSVPYFSDLDPWRTLINPECKDTISEDGLYTGETVLHIAIVKEDSMLVTHLLQLGIEISSRAVGVFFKPKLLTPLSVELNSWQRLKAWLMGVNLERNKYAAISQIENKDSGTYYGEFPLSFAASVGNVEICNILYYYKKLRIDNCDNMECKMTADERASYNMSSGKRQDFERCTSIAKLNQHLYTPSNVQNNNNKKEKLMWNFLHAADSFGNTALHMAVWHQRKDIIDLLVSKQGGAEVLTRCNHEFFTPLTLAARRGFVDIFHHILDKHMGTTAWEYGKVRMIQRDIYQVDTYRIRSNKFMHQNPEWRSALEIIVDHEVLAFAHDELINRLINEKWTKFGRQMYIIRTVVPYMIILCMLSVLAYLRGSHAQKEWSVLQPPESVNCGLILCLWNNSFLSCTTNSTFSGQMNNASLFTTIRDDISPVFECVLCVIGIPFLLWKGWRSSYRMHWRKNDIHDLHKSGNEGPEVKVHWPKNMQFFLDVLGSILIIAVGISRIMCNKTIEVQLLSAACVILHINFLYVLIPFQPIGSLIITINTILVHDVLRFLVVYLIILLGFSWGLFLMFQGSHGFESCVDNEDICGWSPKAEPLWMMLRLAWVSLGDNVGDMQDLYERTPNPQLTLLTYILWVVLSTVLLLNLLIAMMSKTFDNHDRDIHRVWFFPFAALVLRYERFFQLLPEKMRKKYRTGTPIRTSLTAQESREIKDSNLARINEQVLHTSSSVRECREEDFDERFCDLQVKRYEVYNDVQAVRMALDKKKQVEESQPVITAIAEELKKTIEDSLSSIRDACNFPAVDQCQSYASQYSHPLGLPSVAQCSSDQTYTSANHGSTLPQMVTDSEQENSSQDPPAKQLRTSLRTSYAFHEPRVEKQISFINSDQERVVAPDVNDGPARTPRKPNLGVGQGFGVFGPAAEELNAGKDVLRQLMPLPRRKRKSAKLRAGKKPLHIWLGKGASKLTACVESAYD